MARTISPDRPARDAFLVENWGEVSVTTMAERFKTSVGAIYRDARRLKLPTKRKVVRALPRSHPALQNDMPRHTKRLMTARTSPRLLVSGQQNEKIGNRVSKGKWKGKRLFTLTLAERATCPRSCQVYAICYGNNLNWARRHLLDDELIERLKWELISLCARNPGGIVVRPHILGDFGSDKDPALAARYASAWLQWLEDLPGLHLFGFTAWSPDTEVGKIVGRMNADFPDRCRFRFSGHLRGGDGAIVVPTGQAAPMGAFLCPYEQMGDDGERKVKDCASCALCWTSPKTIAFEVH